MKYFQLIKHPFIQFGHYNSRKKMGEFMYNNWKSDHYNPHLLCTSRVWHEEHRKMAKSFNETIFSFLWCSISRNVCNVIPFGKWLCDAINATIITQCSATYIALALPMAQGKQLIGLSPLALFCAVSGDWRTFVVLLSLVLIYFPLEVLHDILLSSGESPQSVQTLERKSI